MKHLAVSAGGVLQRRFCFPSLPRMINSCLFNAAQLFLLFCSDTRAEMGACSLCGLDRQRRLLLGCSAEPEELGRSGNVLG